MRYKWCQQSAFIISALVSTLKWLKYIFHSKFWCSASIMSFYRYFWYLKTAILSPWEVLLEFCPFSLPWMNPVSKYLQKLVTDWVAGITGQIAESEETYLSVVLCVYLKYRNITMCKMKFTLNGVVGHPYGSSFTVCDGQLVKASSSELEGSSADQGFIHWYSWYISITKTTCYL